MELLLYYTIHSFLMMKRGQRKFSMILQSAQQIAKLLFTVSIYLNGIKKIKNNLCLYYLPIQKYLKLKQFHSKNVKNFLQFWLF